MILAGAEPADNWTSLAGALEGALRFLGESVTRPWVMGVSGCAFRLALPTAEGVVAAGPLEAAFAPERTAGLIRNLGRTVEIVAAQPGRRDYAKRRTEVIGRARKSIDRGLPVIVYGLHLPRFGLVKGYDDRAELWFVGSMLSAQYGEALPLNRWPVPERADPVLAVFLGNRARSDPRRAVLAALQYALDYADKGEPGDPTGAVHGRAAYRRWQEAFARGAPPGDAVSLPQRRRPGEPGRPPERRRRPARGTGARGGGASRPARGADPRPLRTRARTMGTGSGAGERGGRTTQGGGCHAAALTLVGPRLRPPSPARGKR